MEVNSLIDTNWNTDFKEKRSKLGLTQNKIATAVGITRGYLVSIESGTKTPSADLKKKLEYALITFNPDSPLDMMFDYVRIRFPTLDVTHIVENILHIKMKYLIHEDFGYYSYSEHYRYGDITILYSQDLEKGTLLELKGKGCRQFENFLLAQHRTWYDFFKDCIKEQCFFKRIDLAINDKKGILKIPDLTKKCEQEECITMFRSFKSYRSGELIHHNEKPDMGNTLYIGSLQSEVYFCVYEKDYEQYIKNNIPIEEAIIKNRFEIRLKNDRATYAIYDLIDHEDAEITAFSIINRYVRFVDKDETIDRSYWKTNDDWSKFIGNNRASLKLTTQPEPYSLVRTLTWLNRQVAPTLKMITKLDRILNLKLLEEMLKKAKLSDKQEQLIKQLSASVDDIIT